MELILSAINANNKNIISRSATGLNNYFPLILCINNPFIRNIFEIIIYGKNDDETNREIMIDAIDNNILGVVKYLSHKSVYINPFSISYDYNSKQIRFLNNAEMVKYVNDKWGMTAAFNRNDIDKMEYLNQEYGLVATQKEMDNALLDGNEEMVDYLEYTYGLKKINFI